MPRNQFSGEPIPMARPESARVATRGLMIEATERAPLSACPSHGFDNRACLFSNLGCGNGVPAQAVLDYYRTEPTPYSTRDCDGAGIRICRDTRETIVYYAATATIRNLLTDWTTINTVNTNVITAPEGIIYRSLFGIDTATGAEPNDHNLI